MDKFVLVLAAALCFSTSAIAEVTCHTDAFGDVNCTGYDKDALSVKITFATLSVLHGVVKHAIFAGVYR